MVLYRRGQHSALPHLKIPPILFDCHKKTVDPHPNDYHCNIGSSGDISKCNNNEYYNSGIGNNNSKNNCSNNDNDKFSNSSSSTIKNNPNNTKTPPKMMGDLPIASGFFWR
jgi:hypothetical protein